MKLRTVLLVLALLAFLSASVGGYLYYSSLKESAFREAERQGSSHAADIGRYVASTLAQNQTSVKALAGLEEMQKALLLANERNLAKVNSELDHFYQALKVSVCYLMDGTGKTIASSNRSAPDSFVGKNYGFRPYFQQAIQGTPTVYMALGVTSKKRGVYYSHPVYGERDNTPLGVVVIKSSVESMEREFSEERGGIALLTDPRGVIFVSSRDDWLYHVLWKVSSKTISQIAKSRQFGEGPWPWSGLKMRKRNHAVDEPGNEHLIYEAKVDNYPGWKVVYLVSLKTIDQSVIDPLIKTSGTIILILCILIGSAVFLLYRAASHDIVQRKTAEELLRESEERFRAISGTAADAIILMDNKGRISYWNPAAERMFGYSPEEAIGRELHLFLAPEEFHHDYKRGFDEFRETGQGPVIGKTAEFIAVNKEGNQFPIEVSTSALEIKGEWHSAGIIRDISERKRAEEELSLQKTYFQHLFDNSPEASVILDKKDRIVDVNSEFEKLFEYSKEEIKGKYINDLIVSEDLIDEARALTQMTLASQVVKKNTVRKRKGGSLVDVSILGYPITFDGEQVGVYAIYKDITESKQAEEALRDSERQYRNLVDNALVGIYKTDLEGNILYVNEALIKMMEFESLEDMKSVGVLARYSNLENRDIFIKTLKRTGKINNFEVDLLTKSGAVKNVILTGALEGDAISGMILDITERRQAVEERIRLATAVEQAAESVIISDRKGTIQYVNPAFERLSGFTKEDIVGQNFRVLKSDKHDEGFYWQMWKQISSGEAWAGRINNRMKDGSLREFETIISPIRDDSGAIVNFVSVNRDVTQEVALEAQLLQAQKMEAVGTLAGGIAHDFNNLLQVIQGYTEVLLHGLNEDPSHHEALQKIHRSAQRGAELTRQLLTFSRKVQSERRPLDLNQEVEQIKNLLERTIPKMIEIEAHVDKTPAIVSADPAQVEQALMNLAVNAVDAMSDGGKIIIEIERASLDEEFCKTHLGARPGEYVLLTISDTGHGMNKEILEHVFEPFYTTKEVGKGTGLGLAMVYGIVKTHEGYILCYSELDFGTTFKIYLPALVQSKHRSEAGEGEDQLKGGDETILLVDDEKYIRELGVELLTDVGYEVLTAIDGESALQLYRKEQKRIDLVILDLVIPGMGGKKCYEEILKINPQAKILIVSGYSVNGPGKEAMEAGAKGFVGKPFDVSHMLTTVRHILDED